MKNLAEKIALLALGAWMADFSSAQAQDWPQWRGVNRDAKAAGFKAPQTWPKELAQKWKVSVGLGDAGPALVGDRLYVFSRQGGEEVAMCLDAATGKELWQDKYEALGATGPASGHSGPRCNPAVANGKVVTLGVRGVLSCLDAASGKKLWRKDEFAGALPRFFTSSSPIILDGLCIAQLGGQNNGGIVAYDLATGDQKWKAGGDGPGYASPILLTAGDARLIVTQTEKSIVAIQLSDGKVAWQVPFAPQGMGYNATTAIVDGSTLIYAGQGRGIKAVKLEKQGDAWAAKEIWSNSEYSPQFNTPVLKGDLLFGITQNGDYFCVNARSGKSAWTAPGTGGRGGYGSIVDAGTVLLAVTPKSQLVVLEPNEKEFKELASFKVSDKQIYAHPVVSGNRVFIKDQDSLTLWSVE